MVSYLHSGEPYLLEPKAYPGSEMGNDFSLLLIFLIEKK